MAYTKEEKDKLYHKYKLREKCKRYKQAEVLKELYKCMVLNISNHIIIKV